MERMSKEQMDFMSSNTHVIISCPHCGTKLIPGGEEGKSLFLSAGDKRDIALYCSKCKKDIPFWMGHQFYMKGYSDSDIEWENKILKLFDLEYLKDEGRN